MREAGVRAFFDMRGVESLLSRLCLSCFFGGIFFEGVWVCQELQMSTMPGETLLRASSMDGR